MSSSASQPASRASASASVCDCSTMVTMSASAEENDVVEISGAVQDGFGSDDQAVLMRKLIERSTRGHHRNVVECNSSGLGDVLVHPRHALSHERHLQRAALRTDPRARDRTPLTHEPSVVVHSHRAIARSAPHHSATRPTRNQAGSSFRIEDQCDSTL